MKNDSLDRLLKDNRILDNEWIAFGKALSISDILKIAPIDRAKEVNKELRHYYGNTITNLARDNYEPDYENPILIETAKICKIDLNLSQVSLERIEEEIYRKLTDSYTEKHPVGWKKCKITSDAYFDQLISIGQNARNTLDIVKEIAIDGGITAGLTRMVNSYTGMFYACNKMFFDTNWKKVLPTILIISVIRKRLKICDIFK